MFTHHLINPEPKPEQEMFMIIHSVVEPFSGAAALGMLIGAFVSLATAPSGSSKEKDKDKEEDKK